VAVVGRPLDEGDFHLGAQKFFFFSQHLGVISLDPQPEVVAVLDNWYLFKRLSDGKGKNCPLE